MQPQSHDFIQPDFRARTVNFQVNVFVIFLTTAVSKSVVLMVCVCSVISAEGCTSTYAGGDFEDQDHGEAVHEGVQE